MSTPLFRIACRSGLSLNSSGFLGCDLAGFDEHEQTGFGGVATTLTEFDDPGVTALTAGESRSDLIKKLLDCAFVVHTGDGETTAVKSSLFAKGDHTFSHTAGSFGFNQSGLDAAAEKETADHIRQHRPAM